ncbi:MAG: alpha/beta fold hydrolase [Desulfobacterales bacterium]|jgi:pimeloyl-ACP methyl ester carboxylesterase|nr:alpha/beta fold hydrolase [Desulfobacteraceae bacterium]MBT7086555.1 alpha/beta fold hydrolase [Desulfobacterales bacterium]MBT7696740.1 alpha/beta fold hydrolase [Desulfobacterales bacterium]
MSTYVLVHGAWHGGWCWDKVVHLLEKEGHKVVAPDLPGHGRDKTPIAEISLEAYAEFVCRVLDDQFEPVVLVGHSMGGAVITQAAEYRPEKISTLVYLAAFLLKDGEMLKQYSADDPESLLARNLISSEDESSLTINDAALKEIFYDDCPDEDVKRARALLVPQPAAPLMTPVRTTKENFGRIRRIYIACNHDKAIDPSIQENMYTKSPCEKVITMNTSHSPFFSAPEELVAHFLSI